MDKIKSCLGSAMVGATAANFGIFVAAATFSWASPVGPKLQSNDPTINPLPRPTTIFEDSLLASIIIPGTLVGTLVAGLSNRMFGKKKSLLIFGVPMVISHLICAYAKNIQVFLWARFLVGIGGGVQYTVVPGYVSEIASENNRGALGTLVGLFLVVGNLYTYSLGPFTCIKVFSFLNIVPLIIFFVVFTFCAESPYELVKMGKMKEAQKTLELLRGTSDVSKELTLIETVLNEQNQQQTHLIDFLRDKTLRKAIMLTCTIMIFQQFSGIGAFMGYMQSIFKASKISIPSEYSPIIVSTIGFISNLVATQFMDRLGRRLSINISMAILVVANGLLGLYFFLKSHTSFDVTKISFVPVFSLVLFFAAYSFGLASVPFIIIGEYFPSTYKNLAATISTFMCFFYCGIVTLSFPFVNTSIGEAGSFWFFALVLICGVIFCLLKMPETKGLTFLEVQDIFKGHNQPIKKLSMV